MINKKATILISKWGGKEAAKTTKYSLISASAIWRFAAFLKLPSDDKKFDHREVGRRALAEAKRHHRQANLSIAFSYVVNCIPIHKHGSPIWLLTFRHASLSKRDHGILLMLWWGTKHRKCVFLPSLSTSPACMFWLHPAQSSYDLIGCAFKGQRKAS